MPLKDEDEADDWRFKRADIEVMVMCADWLGVPFKDVVSIDRAKRTVLVIDGYEYEMPAEWDLT